jgi:hypothetical protein
MSIPAEYGSFRENIANKIYIKPLLKQQVPAGFPKSTFRHIPMVNKVKFLAMGANVGIQDKITTR